jgi:hypothetical protein
MELYSEGVFTLFVVRGSAQLLRWLRLCRSVNDEEGENDNEDLA